MILINNNWVSINNSTDVLNLIRENIGDEAATASKYFVRDERYEDEIDNLRDEIAELENQIEYLENENEELSSFKDSFESLIEELKELKLTGTELSKKLGNIIDEYTEV